MFMGMPKLKGTPRVMGTPKFKGTPRVMGTPKFKGTPRVMGTPKCKGMPTSMGIPKYNQFEKVSAKGHFLRGMTEFEDQFIGITGHIYRLNLERNSSEP